MIPFTRQELRSEVPNSIVSTRATLALDEGTSMKLEEGIIQIILIPSQYGTAYPIDCLGLRREIRSPEFLCAGASRPAKRHLLAWGGGDEIPFLAR